MSYLATVKATRAVILDPTDPFGAQVVCGTRSSAPITQARNGEVLTFAGDRKQAALYEDSATTRPITLAHVSDDDVNQLTLWRGAVLLFRFADGTRLFGVFFEIDPQPVYRTAPDDGTPGPTWDVGLTIYAVTYQEAV